MSPVNHHLAALCHLSTVTWPPCVTSQLSLGCVTCQLSPCRDVLPASCLLVVSPANCNLAVSPANCNLAVSPASRYLAAMCHLLDATLLPCVTCQLSTRCHESTVTCHLTQVCSFSHLLELDLKLALLHVFQGYITCQ